MNNSEAKKTILEADSCFCKHGAYKDCHSGCKYREALDAAVKALEQEPKAGHWIKGYTFPDGAYWKCDKCNELIKVKIPMRYCNNCGAKMVEPQESEDK